METLVAKEEVSRQRYDLAFAEHESYGAEVESATSEVREAEQAVRVAESRVEQQAALKLAQTVLNPQTLRDAPEPLIAHLWRSQRVRFRDRYDRDRARKTSRRPQQEGGGRSPRAAQERRRPDQS